MSSTNINLRDRRNMRNNENKWNQRNNGNMCRENRNREYNCPPIGE
jgi:hypothetical protein